MNIPKLKVQTRTDRGQRLSRRLRKTGMIPAVCYGKNKEPLPITINPEELLEILHGSKGLNSLIELDGAEGRTVFVQDLQRHPLERNLLHVDFLWIDTKKPVQRKVPVELVGEAIGLKAGGIMQVVRRDIEVETLPSNLPESIKLDVSEMDIGAVVHIEDIEMPEGVKALFEINFTVCALQAPTVEEEPETEEGEEGEEGAEGAEGAEGEAAKDAEGEAPKKEEESKK